VALTLCRHRHETGRPWNPPHSGSSYRARSRRCLFVANVPRHAVRGQVSCRAGWMGQWAGLFIFFLRNFARRGESCRVSQMFQNVTDISDKSSQNQATTSPRILAANRTELPCDEMMGFASDAALAGGGGAGERHRRNGDQLARYSATVVGIAAGSSSPPESRKGAPVSDGRWVNTCMTGMREDLMIPWLWCAATPLLLQRANVPTSMRRTLLCAGSAPPLMSMNADAREDGASSRRLDDGERRDWYANPRAHLPQPWRLRSGLTRPRWASSKQVPNPSQHASQHGTKSAPVRKQGPRPRFVHKRRATSPPDPDLEPTYVGELICESKIKALAMAAGLGRRGGTCDSTGQRRQDGDGYGSRGWAPPPGSIGAGR